MSMFRLTRQREIIHFWKLKQHSIQFFFKKKKDIANCEKENLRVDQDGKCPSINEYFKKKNMAEFNNRGIT